MGLLNLPGELKIDPRIQEWLDALAGITDEPPGLTRTFLSPAHEQAKTVVAGWMREIGLEVFEDQAGNLIGRLACGDPAAGTLACGSHLDSVRNAGRFDGPMGIVAALLAAERLVTVGKKLSCHLEVVAFSDEEGVRFQTTYLGSRFYAGTLGETERRLADAAGITVGQAIAAHVPSFPLPPPRRHVGYVEAHIEQGPVLEAAGLALGVVTDIAGQTRAWVELAGQAGHAGTTPMNLRRDALAGAAESVLLIEDFARREGDLVATVGMLEIASPASNVIPGTVRFTIDLRHPHDALREEVSRALFAEIEKRAAARNLQATIEVAMDAPAIQCSAAFCDRLEEIVGRHQSSVPRLVSGAGHDAVALAEVTDVAMLFVRCRAGLSHHPDEFASNEDIALAIDALADFLATFHASPVTSLSPP